MVVRACNKLKECLFSHLIVTELALALIVDKLTHQEVSVLCALLSAVVTTDHLNNSLETKFGVVLLLLIRERIELLHDLLHSCTNRSKWRDLEDPVLYILLDALSLL